MGGQVCSTLFIKLIPLGYSLSAISALLTSIEKNMNMNMNMSVCKLIGRPYICMSLACIGDVGHPYAYLLLSL